MTASSAPEAPAGLSQAPAARWQIRLEVDEPEVRVAAAIDRAGTIIGLAAAGATRDDDVAAAWELYSINVVAQQQGSGVADDLIRAVAVGSESDRESDTSVWVLTTNERAQSFYSRHGFRVDGATTVGKVTGAPELRMVRRCSES